LQVTAHTSSELERVPTLLQQQRQQRQRQAAAGSSRHVGVSQPVSQLGGVALCRPALAHGWLHCQTSLLLCTTASQPAHGTYMQEPPLVEGDGVPLTQPHSDQMLVKHRLILQQGGHRVICAVIRWHILVRDAERPLEWWRPEDGGHCPRRAAGVGHYMRSAIEHLCGEVPAESTSSFSISLNLSRACLGKNDRFLV
jgi:hypothetical protein